jgi:hypothetical protein
MRSTTEGKGVAGGPAAALLHRWKEIRGGEKDEAKEY